jgi:outer membrane biosynthesis protein TonB
VKRRELSPALLGSVALHAIVAAALLISWRYTRELKLGSVVPVTIVADAPAGEPPAATLSPETQAAQAEQPAPEARPEPVPPAPQPTPPAPQPAPAKAEPAPAPKPAKPAEKTAAAKPQTPAKPEKRLDLDALAASLSKASKPAGGKPASAAKGPPKTATAPATGQAMSQAGQAALSGLIQDLERHWNPNCEVEGARDVKVRIIFKIGPYGEVEGNLQQVIRDAPHTVAGTATIRAAQTVLAASPFRDLPRELYGQTITAVFNGKDACT